MTAPRFSDAELGRLLRAHLPAEADSQVREAIREEVEATRQLRAFPGPLGALVDVDPRARRRALLLAATLVLALTAAVAGAVGALLDRLERTPVVDLAIAPPADLPAFVQSAYASMPELQPMTITTLEDGVTMGRIYIDGSGAIRLERYVSPDAAEPETYQIYAGTSTGELLVVDGQPAWREQGGAISEDPRVFVYAELGRGKSGTGKEYGCETAISPGEIYSYVPGNAWRYVGSETVAGRPAHHVTCEGVGDMWIDVDTRLTLRSQGPLRGPGGWPVPGELHTIEVTSLELGQPPPELFEIEPPEGARDLSDEEYQQHQCVRYGWCLESPKPLVTPPPAPDQIPLLAADELVRLAAEAPANQDAYAVTIEQMTTGTSDSGSRVVLYFDGLDRYRVETTSQLGTVWEDTSVTLVGDAYRYSSETLIDGTKIWRSSARGSEGGPRSPYPLEVGLFCEGVEHLGVDLIAGRPADHVGCAGDDVSGAWIDRETHLVVRTQVSFDPSMGVQVSEVVDFSPGLAAGVEWELPADADVRI